MRPDEKALVVTELQGLGLLVGMVGDGANDCLALKAANIGISLSTAEASLAAPFASSKTDISCVDILLREGRCALVTTFQIFKYMAVYAFIQGISVVILYNANTNLGNNQFLYEDLFIVLPLCICMSFTRPAAKLTETKPIARLLSAPVLVSITGHVVILTAYQVLVFLTTGVRDWYVDYVTPCLEADPDNCDTTISVDTTVLFVFSIFQYHSTILAFSLGKPFRKEFWTNWSFCFFLIWVFASSEVLFWVDDLDFNTFIGAVTWPYDWRGTVFGIVIANFFTHLFYEKYLVKPITQCFDNCAKRCCKRNNQKKKRITS